MATLSTFWSQILYALLSVRVFDIIDIAAIAFIIYQATKFFRETRAGQLVKGLIFFLIVFVIVNWFDLLSLKWLLTRVADSIIVVAVIVFQPELRRLLETVGRSNLSRIGKNSTLSEQDSILQCINNVCKAANAMHDSKIGAIIVFERSTHLQEIIDTGTEIDSMVSTEIIQNVFFPNSPLHDGAIVIKKDRLLAAGCILPLTANNELSSQLGTRHRAAIGMSETSDAVVLIVSEETGIISLVVKGIIKRNYNLITLREELNALLIETRQEEKSLFKDIMRIFTKKNKEQ